MSPPEGTATPDSVRFDIETFLLTSALAAEGENGLGVVTQVSPRSFYCHAAWNVRYAATYRRGGALSVLRSIGRVVDARCYSEPSAVAIVQSALNAAMARADGAQYLCTQQLGFRVPWDDSPKTLAMEAARDDVDTARPVAEMSIYFFSVPEGIGYITRKADFEKIESTYQVRWPEPAP